jgi:hypothetical protein
MLKEFLNRNRYVSGKYATPSKYDYQRYREHVFLLNFIPFYGLIRQHKVKKEMEKERLELYDEQQHSN